MIYGPIKHLLCALVLYWDSSCLLGISSYCRLLKCMVMTVHTGSTSGKFICLLSQSCTYTHTHTHTHTHTKTHVDVIYLEPLMLASRHHSLRYTSDKMDQEGRKLFCNLCNISLSLTGLYVSIIVFQVWKFHSLFPEVTVQFLMTDVVWRIGVIGWYICRFWAVTFRQLRCWLWRSTEILVWRKLTWATCHSLPYHWSSVACGLILLVWPTCFTQHCVMFPIHLGWLQNCLSLYIRTLPICSLHIKIVRQKLFIGLIRISVWTVDFNINLSVIYNTLF